MSEDTREGNCSRCGTYSTRLKFMEHEYEDLNNGMHKEPWWICDECDWEILNGHDVDAEGGQILLDRKQLAHEYDPVNYGPWETWQ